jgi:hypothetical protein
MLLEAFINVEKLLLDVATIAMFRAIRLTGMPFHLIKHSAYSAMMVITSKEKAFPCIRLASKISVGPEIPALISFKHTKGSLHGVLRTANRGCTNLIVTTDNITGAIEARI